MSANKPGMPEVVKGWTASILDHWDKQGVMPTLRAHYGEATISKLASLAAETCAVDLYAAKIRRDLETMGLPVTKTAQIIDDTVLVDGEG